MNNKEISMVDLLIETHVGLERQGPGSPETTLKALGFLDNLGSISRTADLGCGSGGQTMVLAQHLAGSIVGVDLFPDFIDAFANNARERGLGDRVMGVVGDALDLPFKTEEFDLIWSEGMIDSIGFEKALRYWNRFLKKDGYVVVTCPSWLTDAHPAEVDQFWSDAGSKLDSIGYNVEAMLKSGYQFAASFTLPETCWTDHYFIPRNAAQKTVLQKYAGNQIVADFIAANQFEMELYAKHKQDYGYVFYIGKKCGKS